MADRGGTVPPLGVNPSSGTMPSAGAMAVGGQMRGEDRYGPALPRRASLLIIPGWDWVGQKFIQQSARLCARGHWRSRFAPLTCDGLHPAGPILGISNSSLTIAPTSCRPMLRCSFGWSRDAIGSTIKRLGRPRPSHPLKVLGGDGATSPDAPPHLPDHAPSKFCGNFSVVWLKLP